MDLDKKNEVQFQADPVIRRDCVKGDWQALAEVCALLRGVLNTPPRCD